MRVRTILFAAVACTLAAAAVAGPGWAPAKTHIMTRWAKDVGPASAHSEYPRPQMVRSDWLNLNGLWDFAVTAKAGAQPSVFDRQILVPFPAGSALSGIDHMVLPSERIWYRRTFRIPDKWAGRRILLNFEAVDWETTVWVNGRQVGSHKGGYDPFSFDITDALRPSGSQEIVVAVWDPSNEGGQPVGKQTLKPAGCFYTPSAGIWQTVWLEPVESAHIVSHKAVPDIDSGVLRVTVDAEGVSAGSTVVVTAIDGAKRISTTTGKPGVEIALPVPNMKLWSPDSPFLYRLRISLVERGGQKDTFTSYFGMRKASVTKDAHGIPRLALNNKVLFQYGPLDQGFWPDGLHTPPTDAALRYDLEVAKRFGCNMVRKHIKVEPRRLYYWADKLGILIWQDMPSGGNPAEMQPQFAEELRRMVDNLYNHPSIIMWVVFNEGWGQHNTEKLVAMVEQQDPSRLVNQASGWADFKVGDVIDAHIYPGPGMPAIEKERPAVLGEFGGVGGTFTGHLWSGEGNFAYLNVPNKDQATEEYVRLLRAVRPLIAKGLCAAVYTQITDLEIEVNGWMTYDRAEFKIDPTAASAAARLLYEPMGAVKTVVACAEDAPQTWRYTTADPGPGWEAPDFDDSAWREGPSGFGTKGTPGARVGTEWATPDIWIRRAFTLDRRLSNPHLNIHHDEDAQVYINGGLALSLSGFTTNYVYEPLGQAAAGLFRVGRNTMAIHCRQTAGGQYIDCGIAEVLPPPKR